MKVIKSSFICALLLSTNIQANEKLDLISVESSTINLNNKTNEVSSSATINEQKIQESTLNNINDVLLSVPGLTISTRTGEMAQIHFRGVGQQQFMGENSGVAIIVDGVPVRQQAGGVRLNLKDIKKIEVIKGSASYLYGDTALAGALIITTKKPKLKNEISLEANFGSFNYKDLLLALKKSNENYALNANASYRKTDGYWLDSELETKSFNTKFAYFLDDSSDISFSSDITDKYDQAGSRSVTSGVSEAKNNPKGMGNSYSKDNFIDLDKYTFSYKKDFINDSSLLISTYLYKDFYEKKQNPQDIDSNKLTPELYTQKVEQNLEQKGLKAEYNLDGNTLASMFGLELGKREYENRTDYLENYSEYNRRKKQNINYYKGENKESIDKEDIFALYTEINYKISSKLRVVFNTRYDYQKKDFTEKKKDFDGTVWTNTKTQDKKSFNNMSYRLGTTYLFQEGFNLYSNISTAFETPDVEDLNSNKNIKEQTSINYELGLKNKKQSYTYDLSIYQLDNKNIIGPEGGTYAFGDPMDNAGDTRSRGLELALNTNRKEKLSFEFSYTYLDAQYTKYNTFKHTYQDKSTHKFNIEGNKVPRTSKHTASIFTNYRLTPKTTLISEIFAKSSYFADETNIVKMPGYAFMNIQTRYKTKYKKNKLEFFAKIKNIFDKQYYRAAYLHRDKRGDIGIDAEDASIVVDPGREFYAGIKYTF